MTLEESREIIPLMLNTTTGLCPDTSENRRDTGRKAGAL